MSEWFICLFLLVGGFFMFLAGLGILRFPDVYTRMHAVTKSGTLGVSGALIALAIYFWNTEITVRAILPIIFTLITTPVSAHCISRSAFKSGIKLSKNSVINEYPKKSD
ncbi:MAG TPA: monovalent cation/H(+) antiporter subunit G [Candidatus Hydrogenedens sp.]|nr:monovalent cation/H(+) antiporter subunit G [Candidatus Hydrogenedens sp.]HOK08488.1 monovalent cation/H(+) antiporter subunit G [Candidatus Hydrogenedens sp.]HOL20348.1 monovalent cation/H(+) antiporter subunit G [Candidatus Hydrogenedens sp.]HPP57842.1 monovalent cation/H(+) antiporter subunit G [Candidatus Hydrogenedens sp.]